MTFVGILREVRHPGPRWTLVLLSVIMSAAAFGQSGGESFADGDLALPSSASPSPAPPILRRPETDPTKTINWNGLFTQTGTFLGVSHAFRVATEPGTRDMSGPFFRGYAGAVKNMHGWSDGDPFLVNYVGHTMQGAVTGFIWTHNDGRYRDVEFGKSARYWKSRLRAAGWAFVYSEQFEIGPASEASIGYIQKFYPQVGFVDHVITPSVGLGWMVMEDALDRFVIRPFEDRVDKGWARLLVRGWLNPARAMANMMAFKKPGYRDTRPGVREYFGKSYREMNPRQPEGEEAPKPLLAPFETAFLVKVKKYSGQGWDRACLGGGGSAALRLADDWQLIIDVNGCQMLGLDSTRRYLSGDSMSYLIGPRWTPSAAGRWSPYAEFLVGANKVTNEYFTPEKRKEYLEATLEHNGKPPDYTEYAEFRESNALQVQAGTGVDLRLSRAFAWRVASLAYSRSWTSPLNGVDYGTGLQFSSGLILRMGTW